jgi:hypothetical protein
MGQLREYVDDGVPAHVLTTGHGTSGSPPAARPTDADKMLSAMRKEFGHEELPTGE